MDPYDILGIRPNAGRDEIELAYKGRRSQYHPDRYAQSDEQTQAWATSKMQEVNSAYRLLSDPDQRAQVDRRKRADDDPPAPAPPPKAERPDVASVLLKPNWAWFHERVHARPDIPGKKLAGALESYAPEVWPEDVIVLLDDTVFGGAREGLLVTNEAIYCKQKLLPPKKLLIKHIRDVKPGPDGSVWINGDEFFDAYVIEHPAVTLFASRLSHAVGLPEAVRKEAPRSERRPAGAGAEKLLTLHRRSLAALKAELGSSAVGIDGLIDRQMRYLVRHFNDMEKMVREKFPDQRASAQIQTAEIMLVLFLMLHYYGFSKLQTDRTGKEFMQFHGISDVYREAFSDQFPRVFGSDFEGDEESLRAMPMVFYHRDGEGDVELEIPREEILLQMMTQMGIQKGEARNVMRQFEDMADAWLDEVA